MAVARAAHPPLSPRTLAIARILLSTIGSAGDVHPFVAIGLALRARGHEVLILTNPYFKDRILGAGLGFWPLGSADEYLRLIKDEALIGGRRSPKFVLNELIAPSFSLTLDAVREVVPVFRPDAIVAHHISFGAAAASERLGLPLISCVLAPLFWFSREDRIALPSFPVVGGPAVVHRALRGWARWMARLSIDPVLNRLRRDAGLAPVRDIFVRAARGGDGVAPRDRLNDPARATTVLGLWSPRFRPPLLDDPIRGTVCGFCAWDRPPTTSHDLDQERATLRWMEDGPAPILVTLGSSVSHHGAGFYAMAADAADRAGVRALLLTGGSDPRADWPAHVRAVPYAAYSRVMPRSSAIVHHAGIGTLAAAMRSGRPEVIVPFANDEFDNAARASRLGVARIVTRRRLSARALGEAIASVARDGAIRGRAQALGEGMLHENGAQRAAEEVERVARAS